MNLKDKLYYLVTGYMTRMGLMLWGGGGGGSSGPSSQTITQNAIPAWAQPYSETLLGQAQNLTDISQNPFQQYQGTTVAGFSPMQQQAFNQVGNMQTNEGTNQAMYGTQNAIQNINPSYQGMQAQNQYGYGPQYQNMGINYQNTQAPNLQNYQMQQPYNVYGNQTQSAYLNAAPQYQGQQFQNPGNVSAQNVSGAQLNAAPTSDAATTQAAQLNAAPTAQASAAQAAQLNAAPQTGYASTQAAQLNAAPTAQAAQFNQPSDVNAQQVAASQVNAPQLNNLSMQAAGNVNGPQLQNYQMQGPQDVTAQQYNAPSMNAAQTGYQPNLQNYQMGPANQVGTQDFTQPGVAQQYMNPYLNASLDPQLKLLNQQYGLAGQGLAANATKSGAFGGSRDILQQGLNQQNQMLAQNQLVSQGYNTAFGQAQQQFNAQQQAALQAQTANQQAGLTVGQQNLGANLQTQQLGTQTGIQAALANLSSSQQANVQNQAAQLQTQGLNAQQAMQAALANQQAGLTTGQQNLGANLQTQNLGATLGQQANLANQSNQQQANLQNLSAGLQTQGLAAQTGMQAQQLNQSTGLQAQQANQQTGLQALLANQQMQYNTGLQNAQFGQQTGLANQALQGQYGLQQGQFGQAANLANQQTQQQALLANQALAGQYGLQQGQFGQAANLQTSAQQQQAALSNQALQGQYGLQQGQFGQAANLANQQTQQQTALANQALQGQYGLQQGQFNQAASLANQQTGLQAALANQQTGYNTNLQNAQFGQQAGLANQALAGQYGLQQGQFSQAANLQTSAQQQQAALANQQMGYNTGQQNLNANLQTQALGAGQNLQSQQLNQAAQLQAQQQALAQSQNANQFAQTNATNAANYGQQAQAANIQQQQFGANYGLQALQQQMAGLNQLGALGNQQYNQQSGINTAQLQAGAQQQALSQQQATTNYQNFINQQNYPYQQIGFMNSLITGTPTYNAGQQVYNAPPSYLSQSVGALGGIGSLMGAYNAQSKGSAEGGVIQSYKKGGVVQHYDEGGIASLMAAKKVSEAPPDQQFPAVEKELANSGDNMSLQQLVKAKMALDTAKQKQGIASVVNIAQQGAQPQQPQQPPQQGQPQQGQPQGQPQQPATIRDSIAKQIGQMAMTDPALMHRIMSGARDNIHGMYEGVASLPLPDDMYSEESQNMAQGGIVAFAERGEVDSSKNPDANVLTKEAEYRNAINRFEQARLNAEQPAPTTSTFGPMNPGANVGKDPAGAPAPTPAPNVQNGVIPPNFDINNYLNKPAAPAGIPAKNTQEKFDISQYLPNAPTGALTGATNTNASAPAPTGAPAAAPSTGAPAAAPPAGKPRVNAKATGNPNVAIPPPPAADPYTSQIAMLKKQADDAGKMITDSTRTREKVLTSQEYANQDIDEQNAFLKAHGMPTAEESLTDKVKRLSEQGAQARKDKDVDRWMAAAQGFFAMGAGQSRYALQNISTGLGVGAKELQTIEKDYRKGEQLRADKTELLNEAARQETLGNYEKGARLRKEAQTRNEKLDDTQIKIAMHLQSNANTVMGNVIAKHGIAQAKLSADQARNSASADANAIRRDNLDRQKEVDKDNALRYKIAGLGTVMAGYETQLKDLNNSMEGMRYAGTTTPKARMEYLKTPEGQAYKQNLETIQRNMNQTREKLAQLQLGEGAGIDPAAIEKLLIDRGVLPK